MYYLEEFQAVQFTDVAVTVAFKTEELHGTAGSSGTLGDSAFHVWFTSSEKALARSLRLRWATSMFWGSSSKACNPAGSPQRIFSLLADSELNSEDSVQGLNSRIIGAALFFMLTCLPNIQ